MPVLTAKDLSVALDGRRVLEEVSFEVDAGERIALVGPNGSGKTTLLRAITGLIRYDGLLALDGREVRDGPPRERARAVALVRQQADLAVDFTVEETVAFGRAPHLGWTEALRPADHERVAVALDALDLGALAGRPVTHLSGGEQQRTLLAQALAQDAPLLLLDEPTAHLDVRHQLDLLNRVTALAEAGRTVIAALHDLELAARFADRLWVLAAGRLVADGLPDVVLSPDLLRDVFGVEAEVEAGPDGVRVRYLSAVRRA